MSDETGWAVRLADGRIICDMTPGVTERDIWLIALGWPTRGEVRAQISAGARAFRCRVVEADA